MRPPLIFWVFNSSSPAPQGPMDPTGGRGTSADIVPTQIIFGVDLCTRCWDIAQKPPKCKNSPLTPIVTKISFASFSARRGRQLPRSRSWCLLYPEPKFHADRTILRWDILNRTNKTKTKTQKANLISRQTLRYGEIINRRFLETCSARKMVRGTERAKEVPVPMGTLLSSGHHLYWPRAMFCMQFCSVKATLHHIHRHRKL